MQLRENILFDNRYLLKKLLGSGGFSEVWLVEDTKVGNKKMALKVYAPGMGLDDDGVQLFSREFELVFDLNHTNLLRPSHFDVCERSPYLLMPYCENGSTIKYVGSFSEEDAWYFLHDVAAGLEYLHAQDPPIIHQDIKPDNILQDNLGRFQITDFGISTKVRSTLRKSLTNTAKAGGTMAYMPPERFGKDNMPIKASDIWSMGATLFELMTGVLPFGEHGGLLQKSGAEIPNIQGNWSNALKEIIILCLQKEPWDRPVAQQIKRLAEKRINGEKPQSYSGNVRISESFKTSRPPVKIKTWGIIACILGLLILFFIIKPFSSDVTNNPKKSINRESSVSKPNFEILKIERIFEWIKIEEKSIPENPVEKEKTVEQPAAVTTPAIETPESSTPPPTWFAEFDRIVNLAQTAYNRKNYTRSKEEYNRALNLANRNGDAQKASLVLNMIAECDSMLFAEKAAVEETRKNTIEDRLSSYNFVNIFPLGSSFMVVQRKADNRWGIINKEGYEVEEFIYSQISERLKNGYYALKNEQGWVVFDNSLNKVASGVESVREFR